MPPISSPVSAGDNILDSQYNNLRADVLNVSTGHRHSGAAEDGRLIPPASISPQGAASGLDADKFEGKQFTELFAQGTYASMLASSPALAGLRWYTTDLGAEFLWDGSKWRLIGHNPEACEHFFDDFLGPSPLLQGGSDAGSGGQSGWRWITSLGGTFDIGDTSRSQASLVTSAGSGGSIFVRTSNFYAIGAANVPALIRARSIQINATSSTLAYTGLVDTYPGGAVKPTSGIFFFADGQTDGNWHAITRSGGADLVNTDTGIVFTGVNLLSIEIMSTTEVKFYIDDVLKATHSVTLPTSNLGFTLRLTNQGSANRSWLVDWVGFWGARG